MPSSSEALQLLSALHRSCSASLLLCIARTQHNMDAFFNNLPLRKRDQFAVLFKQGYKMEEVMIGMNENTKQANFKISKSNDKYMKNISNAAELAVQQIARRNVEDDVIPTSSRAKSPPPTRRNVTFAPREKIISTSRSRWSSSSSSDDEEETPDKIPRYMYGPSTVRITFDESRTSGNTQHSPSRGIFDKISSPGFMDFANKMFAMYEANRNAPTDRERHEDRRQKSKSRDEERSKREKSRPPSRSFEARTDRPRPVHNVYRHLPQTEIPPLISPLNSPSILSKKNHQVSQNHFPVNATSTEENRRSVAVDRAPAPAPKPQPETTSTIGGPRKRTRPLPLGKTHVRKYTLNPEGEEETADKDEYVPQKVTRPISREFVESSTSSEDEEQVLIEAAKTASTSHSQVDLKKLYESLSLIFKKNENPIKK